MVKGDKVRLNHELLIWCGFTRHGRIWTYPDGVDIDNGTPYFPEDETACFRWLVPKLIEDGFSISLYYLAEEHGEYGDEVWHAHVGCDGCNIVIYTEDKDSPALALCLAIQKLIRSK